METTNFTILKKFFKSVVEIVLFMLNVVFSLTNTLLLSLVLSKDFLLDFRKYFLIFSHRKTFYFSEQIWSADLNSCFLNSLMNFMKPFQCLERIAVHVLFMGYRQMSSYSENFENSLEKRLM